MDETVLEKVTEGGVNTVISHGQNKILAQNEWGLKPSYEYVANQLELLAIAEIGVKEQAASQMYPHLNWQSLMNYGADVQVKYRWSCFKLTAAIGYAAGKVVEESLITDGQTGVQTSPFRLQEYYDWQTEYATAARVKAGLALRYNFWKGLYVQADAHLTHAFALKHIASPDRLTTSLRLGYDF